MTGGAVNLSGHPVEHTGSDSVAFGRPATPILRKHALLIRRTPCLPRLAHALGITVWTSDITRSRGTDTPWPGWPLSGERRRVRRPSGDRATSVSLVKPRAGAGEPASVARVALVLVYIRTLTTPWKPHRPPPPGPSHSIFRMIAPLPSCRVYRHFCRFGKLGRSARATRQPSPYPRTAAYPRGPACNSLSHQPHSA